MHDGASCLEEEAQHVESVGYLAPLAFVLALGALAKAASLTKEIQRLTMGLSELRQRVGGGTK